MFGSFCKNSFRTKTDASYAPEYHCAFQHNTALLSDTAVNAVSVFVFRLICIIMEIIIAVDKIIKIIKINKKSNMLKGQNSVNVLI